MKDKRANRSVRTVAALPILLLAALTCFSVWAQSNNTDIHALMELLFLNSRALNDSLKSFSVEHTVVRTEIRGTEDTPAGDELGRTTRLIWAGGQWRKEVADAVMIVNGVKTNDNAMFSTFDGEVRRELFTTGATSSTSSHSGYIVSGDGLYGTIDYAFFHNRIRDRHMVEFLDENRESITGYEQTQDALVLHLDLVDGSGSYKLTLDPQKLFQMTVMEFTDADGNYSRMDVRFEEMQPGIWLPVEGVCDTYLNENGSLTLMRTLRLDTVEPSHVEINQAYPPSFFHLDFPDGTSVTDSTAGGVSYTQGAETSRLVSAMSTTLWKLEKDGPSPTALYDQDARTAAERPEPPVEIRESQESPGSRAVFAGVCLALMGCGIVGFIAVCRGKGVSTRQKDS